MSVILLISITSITLHICSTHEVIGTDGVAFGSSPLATRRHSCESPTFAIGEMALASDVVQSAFDKMLKVISTCGPVVDRCLIDGDIAELCAQVPTDQKGPLCVVHNATDTVNLPELPALGTYFCDPSLTSNKSVVYHNYQNDVFICKDEGGNWKVASKLRGGHTYFFSDSVGGVKPPLSGWMSASGVECADIHVVDQCVWANICVDVLKNKLVKLEKSDVGKPPTLAATEKSPPVPKPLPKIMNTNVTTVPKNVKTVFTPAPCLPAAPPRVRPQCVGPPGFATVPAVPSPAVRPLPLSAVDPTPAFAKAEAKVQPKSIISAFAAYTPTEVDDLCLSRVDASDSDEPNSDEPNPAEASSSSGVNAVSVDATVQPEDGEVRCEWSSAPRGLDL